MSANDFWNWQCESSTRMDSRDYSHYALSHLYSVSSSENEIPYSPYYSTFKPFEEDSKDSENSESNEESESDSSRYDSRSAAIGSPEAPKKASQSSICRGRIGSTWRSKRTMTLWNGWRSLTSLQTSPSSHRSSMFFSPRICCWLMFSGQIIISESHLPPSNRTIHPIDGGLGLHGGTKYVVQGV
jgi:hypothetical protein